MKKKLAIFDIDGTIFRKNLHFELLTELVFSGIFKKTSKKKITKMYSNWVNKTITYEQHRDDMVEVYQRNLIGCNEKDIKKVAKKVAKINSGRTYIFTKNLIEKLRKDYHLLVISGSPIEAVSIYAKILKFDDFFGSVYELDEESKYTGGEVFVPVRNKGAVVKKFIKEKGLSLKGSIGVGDTESDVKFLELTERPIAFNPNKNLKKIAEKRNWEIIVERKDVIYQIKN